MNPTIGKKVIYLYVLEMILYFFFARTKTPLFIGSVPLLQYLGVRLATEKFTMTFFKKEIPVSTSHGGSK